MDEWREILVLIDFQLLMIKRTPLDSDEPERERRLRRMYVAVQDRLHILRMEASRAQD